MFYVFRSSPTDGDNKENVSNSVNDKGYNANATMFAQPYKRNGASHKYTDSVIGSLKNGVVSMWGSSKTSVGSDKNSQRGGRPLLHYGAASVGYPSSAAGYANRRHQLIRRAHSIANSENGFSYSDYGSEGGFSHHSGLSGNSIPGVTLTRQTSSEQLNSKSLELQRKMLLANQTRLAEDLKNEKKNVMMIKAKAHKKVKQMQIQMQAEKRQHQLKEKVAAVKLEQAEQMSKRDKFMVSDLQKKLIALEQDYNNLRIQRNGYNGSAPGSPIAMETQKLINRIQLLEGNNHQLIGHQEKSRRELTSLKETISSCNDTMKQQQNQILILNQQIAEMRKLHGFGRGNSSAEELLQKQIRVLKSQRRMLIQELKDLREQNEQLKNIIVTGGDRTGKK